MPSFRELNSPLGFTHRLCQTLRGCIHEPHNLTLGVLRGFPHFSHGGPYFDKMWSHRTFGLVSRKPVILWYSCSATAYICSFGLPCGPLWKSEETRLHSSSSSIGTSALHLQHQSIFIGVHHYTVQYEILARELRTV